MADSTTRMAIGRMQALWVGLRADLRQSRLAFIWAAAMLGLMLSGCSPVQFAEAPLAVVEPGPKPADEDVVRCGPEEIEVQRPTRVLFVVDQSGSNINGPYQAPGRGTDPQKLFRLRVMNDFLLQHQNKRHLSWGLISFSGDQARSLITQSGQGVFSRDPAEMARALAAFQASRDVGLTPYRKAIETVRDMIQSDLRNGDPDTHYLIAFLTDGFPTDYCQGGPSETLCPGRVRESELDSHLAEIKRLSPSTIQFSTVYYGVPDPEATDRLARMARQNGGEFVDTNLTTRVRIDDILKVPQNVCR